MRVITDDVNYSHQGLEDFQIQITNFSKSEGNVSVNLLAIQNFIHNFTLI